MIILGGIDDDYEILSDGWVLDSRNDTMRQVIKPSESSLKFYSDFNHSYKTSNNSVIAQVIFTEAKHNLQTCFIEFDNSSDKVRKIEFSE